MSLILESLASGVRGAAFMVPGALGAQEGGLVLFGALLGLPADLALAVSLTKRVRELALGLPGLVAWQWDEGRHWLSSPGRQELGILESAAVRSYRGPARAFGDHISARGSTPTASRERPDGRRSGGRQFDLRRQPCASRNCARRVW